MKIKPIKSKKDYEVALKEVEHLMSAKKNTPEGDKLEVISILIENYEAKHFKLRFPDPIEAIKFKMDQLNLKPKDLIPMIGRLNRVYEVLNHKRPLTLRMISNLHKGLGIPTDCLI